MNGIQFFAGLLECDTYSGISAPDDASYMRCGSFHP